MQGKLLLSLGLLGLGVNAQQEQQPAMAVDIDRRDICLVSCGEGWCCVSGQKCIAGPSDDFDTPYGCEDELLGFHTTWEAYRGDFKEFTTTKTTATPDVNVNKPTPEPQPDTEPTDAVPVISRSTIGTSAVPPVVYPTTTTTTTATTESVPESTSSAVVSYPVDEPESSYTTILSSASTSSHPGYVETSYPIPESSSPVSSVTVTYPNYGNSSTTSVQPQTSGKKKCFLPIDIPDCSLIKFVQSLILSHLFLFPLDQKTYDQPS